MKRLLIGLVAVAMMIGLPMISWALSGANVLIVDAYGDGKIDRVIEVDPMTNNVVWEYVTETGFWLWKAIPLTNGNIIVTMRNNSNGKIAEVNPAKQIVWQWNNNSTSFFPNSMQKTPQGTLLFTTDDKVMETTYPPSSNIWEFTTTGFYPTAAERLPGTGTPTYLIAEGGTWGSSNGRVSLMQSNGTILWEYTGLNFPEDAARLADDSILITESGNNRVIKVDYDTKAIIWSYGLSAMPHEAIQIANGNFLIAGSNSHFDKNHR